MGLVAQVQTLDGAVCILLYGDIFGNGMNPSTMSKYLGSLGSLAFSRQPNKEKGNSEFKPALLCLEIDIVSHPAVIYWPLIGQLICGFKIACVAVF